MKTKQHQGEIKTEHFSYLQVQKMRKISMLFNQNKNDFKCSKINKTGDHYTTNKANLSITVKVKLLLKKKTKCRKMLKHENSLDTNNAKDGQKMDHAAN